MNLTRSLAGLALTISTSVLPAAPESGRLNIVFLLADDMGWTGPASFGGDLHETPNIDRLVREGMKFTDAYAACAVCSPSRAAILTGKYPARLLPNPLFPDGKKGRFLTDRLTDEAIRLIEKWKDGPFFLRSEKP